MADTTDTTPMTTPTPSDIAENPPSESSTTTATEKASPTHNPTTTVPKKRKLAKSLSTPTNLTPKSKPKPTDPNSWTPAIEDAVYKLKHTDNLSCTQISARLKEEFGFIKNPNAVKCRLGMLKESRFEWKEDQVEALKDTVREWREKRNDPYAQITWLFRGREVGRDVPAGGVVRKVKELVKEGLIEEVK